MGTSLLQRMVRSKIEAYIQDHKPGDRLPSEIVLAKQLGVSRTTVRTTLAALESDGVISKRHGSGTYINPKQFLQQENLILHYIRYPSLIEMNGYTASRGSVTALPEPASVRAAEALQIAPGTELIAVETPYFADEHFAVLCRDLFCADVIPAETQERFFQKLKRSELQELLFEETGRRAAQNISDIRAVLAAEIPCLQQYISNQDPLAILQMCGTYFDRSLIPLIYSESYINTRYVDLRINR